MHVRGAEDGHIRQATIQLAVCCLGGAVNDWDSRSTVERLSSIAHLAVSPHASICLKRSETR